MISNLSFLHTAVNPLTKGFLGPHQAQSEGDAPRLLLQHLGHLVVSTAYDALVIDGLYVVPDTHGLQAVYGAALLYSLQKKNKHQKSWGGREGRPQVSSLDLDESISGSVVRDGEPQSILRLRHLHLLRLASDVSEDEVFQANLPPQQFLHVHFMRVERAEQNLNTEQGYKSVYKCFTPVWTRVPIYIVKKKSQNRF